MGAGDLAAKGNIDHEALAQGHVNVIAGACIAIGIKVSFSAYFKELRPAMQIEVTPQPC